MSEETTGTELIVLEQITPAKIFTEAGGSESIIDAIRNQVRSLHLDISTEKGRKEIASVAYKIARSKTALDEMGKQLKSDIQKQVDAVDTERKNIRDQLDELKEEIRKPLTDWENAEKLRVQLREERIQVLINLATPLIPDPDVETIDAHLTQLAETEQFDWQEFVMRANMAAKSTREKLEALKAARIKRDEEAAELERLRKEKEERERKEREDRIAAEAAEKAKKEAEDKAAAEAKAAQEKADREKREAEEKAENERKAKEQAEREAQEAKERADKAEADKKAAEEKAEADRKAAAEKAERDKKEAADRAAQEERDRQAAEDKRKADEAAKREADEKHRGKINREVLAAIMQHANLSEAQGKAVVTALAKGLVPHTKVNY